MRNSFLMRNGNHFGLLWEILAVYMNQKIFFLLALKKVHHFSLLKAHLRSEILCNATNSMMFLSMLELIKNLQPLFGVAYCIFDGDWQLALRWKIVRIDPTRS